MMKNKIFAVILCAICALCFIGCAPAIIETEKESPIVFDLTERLQDQLSEIYIADGYSDFDSWSAEFTKQKSEFEGQAQAIIDELGEWLTDEQKCYLKEYEYEITHHCDSITAIQENKTLFDNVVNEARAAKQAQEEEEARLAEEAAAAQYYDYSYSGSSYSYDTPSGGLTAQSGVNYYDGRRETYYSSNVLYHYRTSEWTLDNEGFYRDSDGNYVVAASDKAQGTTFEGSKGTCIVLDSGCAAGTTDYYVAW